MFRFILWLMFQLLVVAFTWEGTSWGLYLVNRASDAAVVVGCALFILSWVLGVYSTVGLWNLWRRK